MLISFTLRFNKERYAHIPTPPKPMSKTFEFFFGFILFNTNPAPVGNAQPK